LVGAAGIVFVIGSLFRGASRGRDVDSGNALSFKGYMLLLVLPVAMGVAGLLVGLFHNWLDFNQRGLGFISLGYQALVWVLEIGSLVVIGVWLVILPIFLRKRKA
jgi:hypothetical protein